MHDFFSSCISCLNCFRYFECRQKHGLFLPLDKLIKLQESPVTQDRTDSGNVHFHDLSPGNGSSNVISQVCIRYTVSHFSYAPLVQFKITRKRM